MPNSIIPFVLLTCISYLIKSLTWFVNLDRPRRAGSIFPLIYGLFPTGIKFEFRLPTEITNVTAGYYLFIFSNNFKLQYSNRINKCEENLPCNNYCKRDIEKSYWKFSFLLLKLNLRSIQILWYRYLKTMSSNCKIKQLQNVFSFPSLAQKYLGHNNIKVEWNM